MERIAVAFEMFLDRHGHFFRTRTRHNVAVARRYLRGLAQAEDCTFESMAAVVEGGCAQQFQHFISCSPWDHEPVVAQIVRSRFDAPSAFIRRADITLPWISPCVPM